MGGGENLGSMMDTLKKFYDLGLDIVRLKPDDKRPLEKWKEASKREFPVIAKWLKSNSNFGAVLGERSNGIVVIDLDQPQLYHEYFKDVDTLVVKTPKKGYHIYLKTGKKQRKIANYLFKPIDLQADRTYVVIPPSSIGGVQYEVVKDRPIKQVKDVEVFLREHLKEVAFNKTLDCKELAQKELGDPELDMGKYTQYLCPFHDDQDTPSFTAYEDGFKCFGCGWSGDAKDFLVKMGKGVDEAFQYLDEHGVDVSDDEIKLQTKRQKQLQMLCEMMRSKYPMVTDVYSNRAYVYFAPRNTWREIQRDGFFKQLVREETGHAILDDELDILVQYVYNFFKEDGNWINFKNKTVNVETGEVREPTPDIFTTTYINYNFNPNAKGELIDKVLREILCDDKDGDSKYKFFFEMLGYFFTGANKYHKMFFITGGGANGKSTLMALISKIFEGYTSSQELQSLHQDFGLQPLLGKKINIVYDLSGRALSDTGTLKAITGEDSVTVNIKNQPQITLKLPVKIVATGNILPKVTNETRAFFRRVVHLELKNTFENPDVDIVMKMTDNDKAMEWLIYKSIDAYQKVQHEGWSKDDAIADVMESYIRVSDPIAWASERLFEAANDEDFISGDNIYRAIKIELQDHEMAVPKRSPKFFKTIKDMGAEPIRRRTEEGQVRGWQGIRFKMPDELAEMRGYGE